jgi:hypothetical protein
MQTCRLRLAIDLPFHCDMNNLGMPDYNIFRIARQSGPCWFVLQAPMP